jgi:hypothetical protein
MPHNNLDDPFESSYTDQRIKSEWWAMTPLKFGWVMFIVALALMLLSTVDGYTSLREPAMLLLPSSVGYLMGVISRRSN